MVTAYLTAVCCISKEIIGHTSDPAGTSMQSRRWSFALSNAIASFSDQQVITGIAILIGGFSQLQWGIGAFHWVNLTNLAWFSAMTHLLTLTTMRQEIRGSKAT